MQYTFIKCLYICMYIKCTCVNDLVLPDIQEHSITLEMMRDIKP